MVIYPDVLLFSSLRANAMLLLASAKLTHMPLSTRRGFLAGLLGAAFSLVILLPPMPLLCVTARFASAAFINFTAFGRMPLARLLRQTVCFLLTALLFCGMVYSLSDRLLHIRCYTFNSVLYMDISLMVLLFGAALAAAAASFAARKKDCAGRTLLLHTRIAGTDYCMNALYDTGNSLRDIFSGKPVVIASRAQFVSSAFPESELIHRCAKRKAFRMLPVTTVTGTHLLPAFQPDYTAVSVAGKKTAERTIDVMLALTNEQTPAIIPACCLR